MKTLPIFLALSTIFALSTQLYDIAEDSSQRSLAFADDMRNALDCATRGIEIRACSPNILTPSFTQELSSFQEILSNFEANQSSFFFLMNQSESLAIVNQDFNASLTLNTIGYFEAIFTYHVFNPYQQEDSIKLAIGEYESLDMSGDSFPDATMLLYGLDEDYALISFISPTDIDTRSLITANAIVDYGTLSFEPMILAILIVLALMLHRRYKRGD